MRNPGLRKLEKHAPPAKVTRRGGLRRTQASIHLTCALTTCLLAACPTAKGNAATTEHAQQTKSSTLRINTTTPTDHHHRSPSATASINHFLAYSANNELGVPGTSLAPRRLPALLPDESPQTFNISAHEHGWIIGIVPEHRTPGSNDEQPANPRYRFTLASLQQHADGFPIWGTRAAVLVRNEPGYPVVLSTGYLLPHATDFRVTPADEANVLSPSQLQSAIDDWFPGRILSDARLVVFAGDHDVPVPPRLAFELIASFPADEAVGAQRTLLVVDANTGRPLRIVPLRTHPDHVSPATDTAPYFGVMDTADWHNTADDTDYNPDATTERNAIPVSGTVRANTGMNGHPPGIGIVGSMAAREALVELTGGGGRTAYTNNAGDFLFEDATGHTGGVVRSTLRGRRFRVFNLAGTPSVLNVNPVPTNGEPITFLHNSPNTVRGEAQANAYIQGNRARNWLLAKAPNFPGLSQLEFPLDVNNTTGGCNAFYDGSRITFFDASTTAGCLNFAYGSVVHHEYMHHAIRIAGLLIQNEYGEGMADAIAAAVMGSPVFAPGYAGNPNIGLRSALNNVQYPCVGNTFECGRLLSGAVWDTRAILLEENPQAFDSLLAPLLVVHPLLQMDGSISPDITDQLLILDDDDGDLSNGTPNFRPINTGFGNRGLLPSFTPQLIFSFPLGRDVLVDAYGGVSFLVVVSPGTAQPSDLSATIRYDLRDGLGFRQGVMNRISPNVYEAVLPDLGCGTEIDYYFTARTRNNQLVTAPQNAPAVFYSAVAATERRVVLDDDFEQNRGWTIGWPGDTATAGVWVRGLPIGTGAQPDSCASSNGVNCFFTGQGPPGGAPGLADVDDGITSLVSPIFDLEGTFDARVSFWAWFSNDRGTNPFIDVFRVQLSEDSGLTWTTALTLGPDGPEAMGGWRRYEIVIPDHITPTATTRLRFLAEDAGPPSLVEAAVDLFKLTAVYCDPPPPPVDLADIDGDGLVTIADYFLFLSLFFSSDPRADINLDGIVSIEDFFRFLNCFFAPGTCLVG